MTAEEARKKTDKALETGINSDHINFVAIYEYIDSLIEEAAENGKSNVVAYVDGSDETYAGVVYKRGKIMSHYDELGYVIEPKGYSKCLESDEFVIKW